jgi:aspartyl-tRNA(Asn)/glutamyl-tRNA(Gln) amidotransferase subunit A
MSATDADLQFLTISEASKLIESRKLSPVELAEALLKRVDALEPQLNAFITLTADRALDDARRAEDAIMAGKYRGPLHGIPYGLKDIYCTKGIRTTGHSKVCADYVPDFDATTVRKLDEAGGVLFGKLSTHEFAHGGPSFDLPWPPARNPWKREHATGGSSSGSGAGVAAGFFMGAMGSDTGGSIRNPAALCGLVGLKPTYGLVSRYGVYANSFTYDHAGPLTWTVEDCAIMMQALAGHDPLDPASASNPIPDYRAALTGDIRGLRIGVIRHFYEEDIKVAPAVKDALEAAYDVLRSLGAVLDDVRIRPAQDYYDVKIVSAESELYAVHEANLRGRPGDFGEDFLGRSLAAIFVRGSDYIQALRERRKMIAEMAPLYEKYDLFVTAGPGPAPRLDAWRTIQFWKSPSLATPFNVTGGPALVQCIGYTEDGLPLSMQVVGKPFDDARVMRVAHAYEKATPWRERRPDLDPNAEFSTALPPVPDLEPDRLSERERDEVAAACRRAGLELDTRAFQQLCATVPYIQAMVERLRRERPFTEEPMNTHRFAG